MTVTIRPLVASDVLAVNVQPMQLIEPQVIDHYYGETVASGEGWTAERDGRVIACAGLVATDSRSALAWGLLSCPIGAGMVAITRKARATIAASRWERIEMLARADWPEALEWAALIGFAQVAVLRRWGPAAADHVLFEVIKDVATSREAAR
jgi:hypothetical protein